MKVLFGHGCTVWSHVKGLVMDEWFLATGVGFSRVRMVWSPMNGLVAGDRIGHCGHG